MKVESLNIWDPKATDSQGGVGGDRCQGDL